MSEEKEIDCSFTDEIVCPYCGHEQSDSWEFWYEADESQCGECEKTFFVEPDITVKYSSMKMPQAEDTPGAAADSPQGSMP